MAQRRSIAGAIKQAAHGAQAATPEPPAAAPAAAARPARARTREGKKMIAAPIQPEARKQLKMLAAELDRKSEDLIREALRDLFIKYDKPGIA